MLDPDPQVCLVSPREFKKAIQLSRQEMGTFPHHLQLSHFIYLCCLSGWVILLRHYFYTVLNIRPFEGGEDDTSNGETY